MLIRSTVRRTVGTLTVEPVSIFESLQGLTLDTKALFAILAILWTISEVRHAIRHRADQHIIRRLQTGDDRAERANIETLRLPEVTHGAALTLGEMAPRGADAGQHFVGAIKNTGSLTAVDIQVTASLGATRADILAVPRRLLPDSAAALVDVRLPFGFLTSTDVLSELHAGETLQVRVAFTDETAVPRVLEECFAFHLEPSDAGATMQHWVSRRVPCPGDATPAGASFE